MPFESAPKSQNQESREGQPKPHPIFVYRAKLKGDHSSLYYLEGNVHATRDEWQKMVAKNQDPRERGGTYIIATPEIGTFSLKEQALRFADFTKDRVDPDIEAAGRGSYRFPKEETRGDRFNETLSIVRDGNSHLGEVDFANALNEEEYNEFITELVAARKKQKQ